MKRVKCRAGRFGLSIASSIFPPEIPELIVEELCCPCGKRTARKRSLSLSDAHDQRPPAA